MASYRKLTAGWTARIRVKNHPEENRSGFRTKEEAKTWAKPIESRLRDVRSVKGLGPLKTTLAVALRDYAYEVTATQGGCVQALCKINKYLQAAGLKTLQATRIKGGRKFGLDSHGVPSALLQTVENPLFELTERAGPAVFQHAQQKSFEKRRLENVQKGARAQHHRETLARLPVSQIEAFHLTQLVRVMSDGGYAAATQRQELAILSSFITHATKVWNWPLVRNPALQFEWPIGAERDRVMTDEESGRMAASLAAREDTEFAIFILFALETAMRKGEALWTACWCDVDYANSVLHLPHAKTGRREVPLSPEAIAILQSKPQGAPTETIFNLTLAAVDTAWKRLCADAEIVNLHIHDLRHTAATMWAELLNGDIFKLKEITGHRTLKMLQRYVNPNARKVARQLSAIAAPTTSASMRRQMALAQAQPSTMAASVAVEQTVANESREPMPSLAEVSEEAILGGVADAGTPGNVLSFAVYREQKEQRNSVLRTADR